MGKVFLFVLIFTRVNLQYVAYTAPQTWSCDPLHNVPTTQPHNIIARNWGKGGINLGRVSIIFFFSLIIGTPTSSFIGSYLVE